MPVKPEEAINYFGYTPEQLEAFESIDAFKTDVEKKYIAKDNFVKLAVKDPEVTGKLFGSLTTKAKSIAKTFGVEFQPEEIKDAPPEKIFELGFTKYAAASTKALEEANSKAGAPPAELIKEWEAKVGIEKKGKEDYKAALETLQGEFKTHQENVKLNEKKNLFQREWDTAISKINFSPTVSKDPFRKKGWIDTQKELFNLEMDDDGKIYPVDKDGHRIKNPKIASGIYESISEVLLENAAKDGVTELNPHGSKPAPRPVTPVPASNGNGHQQESTTPKINPYRPVINTPSGK